MEDDLLPERVDRVRREVGGHVAHSWSPGRLRPRRVAEDHFAPLTAAQRRQVHRLLTKLLADVAS